MDMKGKDMESHECETPFPYTWVKTHTQTSLSHVVQYCSVLRTYIISLITLKTAGQQQISTHIPVADFEHQLLLFWLR